MVHGYKTKDKEEENNTTKVEIWNTRESFPTINLKESELYTMNLQIILAQKNPITKICLKKKIGTNMKDLLKMAKNQAGVLFILWGDRDLKVSFLKIKLMDLGLTFLRWMSLF